MATQAQIKQYVEKLYPVAVMATAGTKVLPGTVLTTSGVESAWGLSKLAKDHNNYFGIKAGSSWKGAKASYPTKEGTTGKQHTEIAAFRAYSSPVESFKDYVELLTKSKRYAKVLQEITPQGQFKQLQAGGYSTNKDYPVIMQATLSKLSKYLTGATPAVKVAAGSGLIMLIGGGALVYYLQSRRA